MSEPVHLPHSIESERAILACVLLEPSILDRLDLDSGDFYSERHQILFRAMEQVADDGVDIRTVQAHLESEGKLKQAGGTSYLATLDMDLPDLGQWRSYESIVRERSVRRSLARLSQRLMKASTNGQEVDDTLQMAQRELRVIEQGATPGEVIPPIGEGLMPWLEGVLKRKPGEGTGITTGLPALDKATQGIKPGQQWVIGGRQGQGKSALAFQIAVQAASEGNHVYFVSREMPEESLLFRLLSAETGIEQHRVSGNFLSRDEKKRIWQSGKDVQDLPLYIDFSGDTDCGSIIRTIRKQNTKQGVDLVVVDYLQLLHMRSKGDNRHEEIMSMSRSFKVLALDLCPVILLSQFKRGERKGRPTLHDFRGSSAIESDADVCLGVYRPEALSGRKDQKAELLILKQRNGRTGIIGEKENLRFSGPRVRFYQRLERMER